jgi:hypothetical protein
VACGVCGRIGLAAPVLVSAGTRRGLPPSRCSWCASIGGLLRGLAVRFSASSAGDFTIRRLRHDRLPNPAELPASPARPFARRFRAGRPGRDASREVCFPTAHAGHAAPSGAAGLRTIPLRRSGSCCAAFGENTPLPAARRAFALAVFRLASIVDLSDGLVVRGRLLSRRVRWRLRTPPDPGHAPPDFRSAGGVPLPAIGCFVALPESGARRTAHCRYDAAARYRRRSWASPFAVLLLPAGPRRFRPGLPPAVSRTIHPGLFSRGAGAGVRLSSSAGRGRSPRLLGFVPAGNPFRRLLAGFRRPRLPWAFSSLRFVDRRLWRVGAASCSDVIGNPAAEPRGSRHVLEQLIARDQQPQCPASGAYPLVGLGRIIPVFVAITRLAARAAPRTRTME